MTPLQYFNQAREVSEKYNEHLTIRAVMIEMVNDDLQSPSLTYSPLTLMLFPPPPYPLPSLPHILCTPPPQKLSLPQSPLTASLRTSLYLNRKREESFLLMDFCQYLQWDEAAAVMQCVSLALCLQLACKHTMVCTDWW